MRRHRMALLATCSALLIPRAAISADKSWNALVTGGSWSVDANWLPTAIPDGSSDAIFINFNDLDDHEITYDGSFNGNYGMQISNTGTGKTIFLKNLHNIVTVGSFDLGGGGNAAVTQSAGTFAVSSSLLLAGSSTGKAVYNLSGGTLLVDRSLIGAAGSASFNQTSGSSRSTFLYLGSQSGSNGNYLMSGDSDLYVTTYEAVGFYGAGTFAQSGGTHFGGLEMYIGANTGGSGRYDLSGTGFVFSGNEYVGNFGTGSFIQRDNSCNAISADLSIGSYSTGRGIYTLSGNAAVSVIQSEYVGRSGLGTFVQDGGSHTVRNGLYVGRNLTGGGTYNLSGGSLSIAGAGEFIGYGGRGAFIQSGGTHRITSNLFIAYNSASAGTYSIASGLLNVGSSLYVGGDDLFTGGSASFMISGGTVNVATSTRVWRYGQINYTGGSFSAGTLILSSGGKLLLTSGGNKTLRVTNISVDSSSKLDLADNNAVVAYGAGVPPVASIRAQLRSGYNQGNWLGNGITSSSAAVDRTKSLGYVNVPSAGLLIKYAWSGDSNFDGQVDLNDLAALAQHWNTPNNPWINGDFDYDGFVNVADLYILAKNWQAGVGNASSSPLAPILADLGLPLIEVPEPFSLIYIPALLAWSLKRSRRSIKDGSIFPNAS